MRRRALTRGWPATLAEGPVGLRPLRLRDRSAWLEIRRRNESWLRPWEATRPGEHIPGLTFSQMVARLRSDARAGRTLPFAVTYNGELCGQLTVAGITWGSLCAGHIGYWIDRDRAGLGIMPTAVALAVDHCFSTLGLHRIEICIRPENHNSRRVVEKLGFREEGTRPRFLHIDGGWRDHLVYVLTAEEVPGGLVRRWRATRGPLATS